MRHIRHAACSEGSRALLWEVDVALKAAWMRLRIEFFDSITVENDNPVSSVVASMSMRFGH